MKWNTGENSLSISIYSDIAVEWVFIAIAREKWAQLGVLFNVVWERSTFVLVEQFDIDVMLMGWNHATLWTYQVTRIYVFSLLYLFNKRFVFNLVWIVFVCLFGFEMKIKIKMNPELVSVYFIKFLIPNLILSTAYHSPIPIWTFFIHSMFVCEVTKLRAC